VPMTREARMAFVWPAGVVMVVSPWVEFVRCP
jgi:hypothetical protein